MRILEIVVPSLFSSVLEDLVWQVTAIYAGKTKDVHILAAIGMVQNINMLLPYSLTFGTGRALCTLVS
jgi:Na+-driven multidrug efflux pump